MSFFVLDEVPYSVRKEKGEKVPHFLVPNVEVKNDKNLKRAFEYVAGPQKLEQFKAFLEYQLRNSPNVEKLKSYLELEYVPYLMYHLETTKKGPLSKFVAAKYHKGIFKTKIKLVKTCIKKNTSRESADAGINNFEDLFKRNGQEIYNIILEDWEPFSDIVIKPIMWSELLMRCRKKGILKENIQNVTFARVINKDFGQSISKGNLNSF